MNNLIDAINTFMDKFEKKEAAAEDAAKVVNLAEDLSRQLLDSGTSCKTDDNCSDNWVSALARLQKYKDDRVRDGKPPSACKIFGQVCVAASLINRN
jgi:hypothetical protein